MRDEGKTKEQLINELVEMRQRIGELEVSETERKRVEEELEAQRNKLESIIAAMEYGLTIQDLDYNIIYQNEVLSNIFGSLGEKCYWVYEGKDKVCDGCPVEIAFKDGKSHTSERKVIMPSGEIAFWENTANPIRDASGKIVSCLEIARDITNLKRVEEALRKTQDELEIRVEERTAELAKANEELRIEIAERKKAEEILRQSENKYRTLLENLPQKIFHKDKNSVYISCNKNLARDLKINPDEITGKTDYDLAPRELAEKYRADDKRIMESGKTEEIEERYIQDGR